MAKVFCIYEENHGFIAVATTLNASAHWLIDSGWVDKMTDYYHNGMMESVCLEKIIPDSHKEEWEKWFVDQVENREDFLENLGFQVVEEALIGEVEDLLPHGRFG